MGYTMIVLTPEIPTETPAVSAIRSSCISPGESYIFPTFPALVQGPGGSVKARGFIDTVAAMSCVSSCLASSVKAKRKRQTTFIVPFGAESSSCCEIITTIQLQHSSGDVPAIPMSMVVVDKILDSLPSSPVDGVRSLPCLAGLELADPEFDQSGRLDLLIGFNMANIQMRTLDLDTPKGLMVTSSR